MCYKPLSHNHSDYCRRTMVYHQYNILFQSQNTYVCLMSTTCTDVVMVSGRLLINVIFCLIHDLDIYRVLRASVSPSVYTHSWLNILSLIVCLYLPGIARLLLDKCRATVCDAGPILVQQWLIVTCLSACQEISGSACRMITVAMVTT